MDQSIIQEQIIRNELQLWQNSQYQLELRQRVYRRIGDSDADIIKELLRCEAAKDVLNEELTKVTANRVKHSAKEVA